MDKYLLRSTSSIDQLKPKSTNSLAERRIPFLEPVCWPERGEAEAGARRRNPDPASREKDPFLLALCGRERGEAEMTKLNVIARLFGRGALSSATLHEILCLRPFMKAKM